MSNRERRVNCRVPWVDRRPAAWVKAFRRWMLQAFLRRPFCGDGMDPSWWRAYKQAFRAGYRAGLRAAAAASIPAEKQEVSADQVSEVITTALGVLDESQAVLARSRHLERELLARGCVICPNPDCGMVMLALVIHGAGSFCSYCGTAIPDQAPPS